MIRRLFGRKKEMRMEDLPDIPAVHAYVEDQNITVGPLFEIPPTRSVAVPIDGEIVPVEMLSRRQRKNLYHMIMTDHNDSEDLGKTPKYPEKMFSIIEAPANEEPSISESVAYLPKSILKFGIDAQKQQMHESYFGQDSGELGEFVDDSQSMPPQTQHFSEKPLESLETSPSTYSPSRVSRVYDSLVQIWALSKKKRNALIHQNEELANQNALLLQESGDLKKRIYSLEEKIDSLNEAASYGADIQQTLVDASARIQQYAATLEKDVRAIIDAPISEYPQQPFSQTAVDRKKLDFEQLFKNIEQHVPPMMYDSYVSKIGQQLRDAEHAAINRINAFLKKPHPTYALRYALNATHALHNAIQSIELQSVIAHTLSDHAEELTQYEAQKTKITGEFKRAFSRYVNVLDEQKVIFDKNIIDDAFEEAATHYKSVGFSNIIQRLSDVDPLAAPALESTLANAHADIVAHADEHLQKSASLGEEYLFRTASAYRRLIQAWDDAPNGHLVASLQGKIDAAIEGYVAEKLRPVEMLVTLAYVAKQSQPNLAYYTDVHAKAEEWAPLIEQSSRIVGHRVMFADEIIHKARSLIEPASTDARQ